MVLACALDRFFRRRRIPALGGSALSQGFPGIVGSQEVRTCDNASVRGRGEITVYKMICLFSQYNIKRRISTATGTNFLIALL